MFKRFSILAVFGAWLLATAVANAQVVNVQSVPLGAGEREAWMIESHDVPIITVRLAFEGAGVASDSKGKGGRAQMASMLLDEGAGELDALAFQQALQDHAIRLSFGVDDDTLTVSMETLEEHADKAFELLGLALSQPQLDEHAIARVKAQMHTALRQSEEEPRYVASRLLATELLGNHPYANPSLGTHESIDALTADDLKAYLQQYVTEANLVMAVVGDVDATRLQSLTAQHLAGLSAASDADVPEIAELQLMAAGQTRVQKRDIPQTVVYVGGQGLPRNHPDFYIGYVLNHLLGGGTLTSRLGDEIREKRGLAYYAYSSLSWQQHGAWFSGGFGTRNSQAPDALSIYMQTVRDIQAGNITQKELDDAKGYLTGAFPLALADNDGLAGMLISMQRYGLGKDYIAKRNDYIEAVTLEEVKRVAGEVLHPSRMVVVAVGDPAKNLADYR